MRFIRKYTVDHDFFKSWSYDMAYILGFWWADGCICGDIFTITQKKSDDYILHAMLKCMHSDYPVRITRGSYSVFQIRSRQIVDTVKLLGGTERKSKIARLPYVPEEYFADFIRGLWDGDGTITKHTGHNRKSYLSVLTSGSKKFLKEIQQKLKSTIPNMRGGTITTTVTEKGHIVCGHPLRNTSTTYNLHLSVNDTKRLGKMAYYDGCNLRLVRKELIFRGLSEIAEATYDKVYLSYPRAQAFVSTLGLKGWDEWHTFSSSGRRPLDIPSNPNRTYRGQFKGIKEFLGVTSR